MNLLQHRLIAISTAICLLVGCGGGSEPDPTVEDMAGPVTEPVPEPVPVPVPVTEPVPVPEPVPDDNQTPSSNDIAVAEYDATVTADLLNVRSGPGTQFNIIGTRFEGQIVKVTHNNGEWRRIRWSPGVNAYVHGDYLRRGFRDRETITIVVKSFIAPIGNSVGSLGGNFGVRSARDAGLRLFAADSDNLFSENPQDATKSDESGNYRLYSKLTIDATCDGEVLTINDHRLNSDTGIEPFIRVSLETIPVPSLSSIPIPTISRSGTRKPPRMIGKYEHRKVDRRTWNFIYYFRGKPHSDLEPAFSSINFTIRTTTNVLPLFQPVPRTRDNPYIWHKIGGKILCDNGSPSWIMNTFSGSKFPSHRYWVDDTQYTTKDQGDFSELWNLTRPSL